MPVQEIDTLGEIEFGGYPFGNVVFLSFDVDVNIGDELSLEFLEANNASFSNLLSIDWGDDTANSTQSTASHTYQEGGVFTVNVVAQPDFEGVTEVGLKQPDPNKPRLGISGVDFTKVDDLTRFTLQRFTFSGSLSLPTSNTYDEILLINLDGDNINVNNIPKASRHVWKLNSKGDWDQFVSQKPAKTLDAGGSSESTKQSIGSLPDEFEKLDLPSKVYLDVRAVSSSTNLDLLSANLGDTNGTFDAKDQEALIKTIGQADRILLGEAEGRVYLEAGFNFFSTTSINSCSGYPSQSMLNNFALGDGTYRAGFLRIYLKDGLTVDGETPQNLPYVAGSSTPATKDHSSFVDALWQEGVNNGNFASDFNCRIREGTGESSLYQEALNKIMGVGPQSASWHASNQGGLAERDYWEVLLGRNRTVTDYLQMNTTVTYYPSTPRLEIDMSNVIKDTTKSPTTYRSFTLDEYTNTGFAVGNDFRIYGSGFTGFDGAYRVAGSSYDSTAEIITVNFDTAYNDPTTDLGTQETISNGSIWGQLGDNPNR